MSFDIGALDERASRLFSRFGAAACGAEVVCDDELCGHITASARIYNSDHTRTLQVWSAKNERWQLPGAHGEGSLDLEPIARREARRALGLSPDAELPVGKIGGIVTEDVAEYWNTPAHVHLAVVFEFVADEPTELPTGAQWFDGHVAP